MRTTQRVLVAFVLAALPAVSAAAPPRPGVRPLPKAAASRALGQGLDRPVLRAGSLPRGTLVLLVEFADETHADNWTPEALDAAFFGGEGSVRDYYAQASFGRYEASGTVHPWIRLSRTQAFYTDRSAGIGGEDPRNARRMVADLVRAADAEVDFSRFDNDGPDGVPSSGDDDGRVDALMVVHAGDTQEQSGRFDRFLSHAWFTPEVVHTNDGVSVWEYALVGEASPLGVRAHEFGHLLGLPDLYDRAALLQTASGGLGDWSLMAAGAWLGDGLGRTGHRPADLDAVSKILLGFVDPIVPAANTSGLRLRARAGDQPPDVYQVWTHGRIENEYLVAINRRRNGLDAELPGGGMLVYHVNLARATNDDPNDLRIQLLQADGLAEVERFVNNGDADDPWPTSVGSNCCRLDAGTNPSTRARDGSDSQIVFSNISSPATEMSFDLIVETQPSLRVRNHAVRELEGDGDGVPEAGELLAFDVVVENRGLRSTQLDLTWRAEPVGDAIWDVDRAALAPLDKGQSAGATFLLRPAPTLADPSALHVVGMATETNTTSHALARTLALGEHVGFLACFNAVTSSVTRDCDDPAAAWSVDVLRGDASWSLEARAGDLGMVYRSARGERYPNAVDVALVTPAFNVEPGRELHLLHEYDIETLAAGWALDGGRVEISLHGGAWQALTPQLGYPQRLFATSIPYLAEAGVFAGVSTRRWDVFAFPPQTGSARLRFRFVSNDSVGATGWQIARVEVRPPLSEAALQTQLRILAEPNPARLPTRVAFRVSAPRSVAAQSTRLLVYDVRGRLVRELWHAPVPAQSARFIWDGMDHAGRVVPAGVYWTRLEWGREAATAKLVVIR